MADDRAPFGIAFERSFRTTEYLDPGHDWAPAEITSEIRRDPLLKSTGRLAHFVGFAPEPQDFRELAATTRDACPFCPDRLETVTPQLPPDVFAEGRLRSGRACLVPNLSPYDSFSAVIVMGDEHFVAIDAWTGDALSDAMALAQRYANAVREHGNDLPYTLLSWNYMPPAASTQIHPHLQAIVTDSPGASVTSRIRAQREYQDRWGRAYFDDLVTAERDLGERFVIETDELAVITDFVSLSALSDVRMIFKRHQVLDTLEDQTMRHFGDVACRLLAALGQTGVSSFNMSFFPGTRNDGDGGRLHAVLTPRISLSPALHATDVGALNLQLGEPFMARSPEDLSSLLRSALGTHTSVSSPSGGS